MRELIAEYRAITHPRNVILISLSHGINEFYSIMIPPIIPFLVADLNITYTQAGLLLTVFFVMYSIFQLPAGLVADRVGKKRILVWGLVGMAGGILVASTAQTYEMVVVAQGLIGISGSTYHPAGMSLISDLETETTEGKAMGVFGFGGMLGVAVAPLMVGGVASLFNWRIALISATIAGILATLLFQLFFLEKHLESTNTGEQPAELSGSDPNHKSPQLHGDDGVIAKTHKIAVSTLKFRVTTGVVVLTVITLLISLQIRALHTFATGFLVVGTGQSTTMANGIFSLMLSASAVASIWVGSLADRVNRSLLGVTAAGLTSLILLAMFFLTGIDARINEWLITSMLAVSFSLLGLTVYGCSPVKNAMISEYATEDSSSSLFGVMQTASAAGSAVGPAIFGYIATEFGIGISFPLTATISVLIATGFIILSRVGGA